MTADEDGGQPAGESSDGSDRSTVYVIGRQSGGGQERALHTRHDCPTVQNADAVFEKDRSVFPDDKPVCNTCSGEMEQPEAHDFSHYHALVAAAGPEGEDA